MAVQKLIFTLCFLSLLIVGNQRSYSDDNDITVTHPSVFHEEYSDYKTTIQGSEDDHLFGSNKPPKSLDLEGPSRSVFDQISESSSSSSDTSDLTDASESLDSDDLNRMFGRISGKAREFEGKALSEIRKQKRLAKLYTTRHWQALKSKIMREADATNLSAEVVKAKLKHAKRNAKKAWKDLKWKIRNGNDILEELMSNMDDLNPNINNNKKGSTEPVVENDTAFSKESMI